MMSDFDRAFAKVIGHEGGYVNHPADPGGETKFGITKRTYPDVDIRNLTLDGAKAIYKRDFWDKVRGDDLRWPVSFNAFDGAVNSGVSQSAKWLQRAAGLTGDRVDGKIGPVTLGAVNAADPDIIAARYNGVRLQFMTDLKTWGTFGKGWARRIAGNLML
jgi:lysozyme family protein